MEPNAFLSKGHESYAASCSACSTLFDDGNVPCTENCLTRQLALCTPGVPNGKTRFSATVMFHLPAACANGPSVTHSPKPSPPMDSSCHNRAVCRGLVQSQ